MSLIYNATILFKHGNGDPSTSLQLGEPGWDITNSRLYIGKGIGSQAIPLVNITDISSVSADVAQIKSDLSTNAYHYVKEASLSTDFYWNNGLLEVSTNFGGVTIQYVDGSLAIRDASITALKLKDTQIDSSLNYLYTVQAGDITKIYVDGSLAIRDASITLLKSTKADITYVDGSLSLRDASITTLNLKDIQIDSSISRIDNVNAIQDVSIAALFAAGSGVYGSNYQLASDLTSTTTSATTPQPKVTLTTPSLPLGTYRILAHWLWSHNVTYSDMRANITVNGTAQGTQTISIELSDAATVHDGTRIHYVSLSGINTIVLNYWNEAGSTTMSDATIELIRVS